MAKSSSKAKATPFTWKGYKNINISDKLHDSVEKFLTDDKEIFALWNSLLLKDYTFKFYFDVKSESFKCTVTCMNSEEPNFGYAMSAYGDNWYTALGVVIFKHVEISQGDWDSVASDSFGRFG